MAQIDSVIGVAAIVYFERPLYFDYTMPASFPSSDG